MLRLSAYAFLISFVQPAAFAGEPSHSQLLSAHRSTDWLLPNHDYEGSRHSPLTGIDAGNAGALKQVCSIELNEGSRFLGAPLVQGGMLFVTSGDATFALDAAHCTLRWRHDGSAPTAAPDARLQPVYNAFRSGGVALRDGALIRATSDGRLIALDSASGRLLWQRTVASADRYEFISMAPLIFEDRIVAGIGISEYAVKGWIAAFRLSDGAPLWRFNTVPDAGEPGAETWSEDGARQHGGGGVWTTPSLDSASGTLYAAVGNPVPDLHGGRRLGSNLYTSSLIALDVRTGKLKWHRQFVPHDLHDWDMTVAAPLYQVTRGADIHRLLAAGGKDGMLRSLDRDTGEQVFESAVTTRLNVDAPPTPEGVRACPGILGGMQWSTPTHHPALDLLVVPAVDWCGTFIKGNDPSPVPGQLYLGGSYRADPVDQRRGWLTALDAGDGGVRWRYAATTPMLASVTTTASGLVLTGELSGQFLVLNALDGTVLYRHDTGSPLHAGIITYAVDGRQYIAVSAGHTTGFWRAPITSSRVMIYAVP